MGGTISQVAANNI